MLHKATAAHTYSEEVQFKDSKLLTRPSRGSSCLCWDTCQSTCLCPLFIYPLAMKVETMETTTVISPGCKSAFNTIKIYRHFNSLGSLWGLTSFWSQPQATPPAVFANSTLAFFSNSRGFLLSRALLMMRFYRGDLNLDISHM